MSYFSLLDAGYRYDEPAIVKDKRQQENFYGVSLRGGTLEDCRIIKLRYHSGTLKNCEVGTVFYQDEELIRMECIDCKIHAIVIEADKIEDILSDESLYVMVKELGIEDVIIYRRWRGDNPEDFKNTDFSKLRCFKTVYIYGDWRERYLTQHVKKVEGLNVKDYGYDFFGHSGVNTWETPWFDAKRMKLPYNEY